jgi:hypothetical protein
MITVMKIPIYLRIETEDVDRAVLSREISERLMPRLVKVLCSLGNRSSLTEMEAKALQEISSKFHIDLIDEVSAMIKRS